MVKDSQIQGMANAIRFLAIDAVQKANSGHPGMPMGMADVATVLFSEFLKFNPEDPKWPNRDRFILSAGHGSMLLYSLLYLTGYQDIEIGDLKNFRQLHSKTAGHPEYGELAAIETTTGPLGQGVANGIGMALAERMANAKFGDDLVSHKTYVIAGDGCLMEGISYEAISLAGHLGLNNLVILWDNNEISIDGSTNLTTSEDIPARFKAAKWEVIEIDGHNPKEIRQALQEAQEAEKPVMISCRTTIGFGSPNKANSAGSHGAPLGEEEITKTRENLGWNYPPFELPDEVVEAWRQSARKSLNNYQKWQENYAKSPLNNEFWRLQEGILPNFSETLQELKDEIALNKPGQASRKSSGAVLEVLTKNIPELIAGSADLTGSVNTRTEATSQAITQENFAGRYIHYGVREHAMGAIMNGLALYGGFIPYAGTFLVFADYMKPAMRLSALMKQRVLYVLTHDSIGLGEDGPTHQPIEHLAMLRAIPNFNVFRPADTTEVIGCYEVALKQKHTPSGLVFSRQNIAYCDGDSAKCAQGGYVLNGNNDAKITLIASGSELPIALETQTLLAEEGIVAKIVSMPCLDLFFQQSESYQKEILGENSLRVVIEAGAKQGWEGILEKDGIFIGMNSFGASAPAKDLFKHFGINAENAVAKIKEKIS